MHKQMHGKSVINLQIKKCGKVWKVNIKKRIVLYSQFGKKWNAWKMYVQMHGKTFHIWKNRFTHFIWFFN